VSHIFSEGIIFEGFVDLDVAVLENVLFIFGLFQSIVIFWSYPTFGCGRVTLSNGGSLSTGKSYRIQIQRQKTTYDANARKITLAGCLRSRGGRAEVMKILSF
jgi:hypothetical protein